MIRKVLLFLSTFGVMALAQTGGRDEARLKALDGTVGALYATISGPEGKARDLTALRAMLHPQARHAFVVRDAEGRPQLRQFGLEDFLQFTQPVWEKGFFEREIARRVEIYAHVAHVFSTYEVRLKAEGPVVRRGINSFQFMHDGERWRLLSAFWEGETGDEPIPDRYLSGR